MSRKPAVAKPQTAPLYSVETFDPQESVGKLIGMVRSQLMADLDQELADIGLTGAQLPVLHWICQASEPTAATLCRSTGTDTGSMTRMLDRLEEKGFVRRVRNANDRRLVNVELTAAGRALWPMISPRVVAVLNRNLAGFSADDHDKLKELLRRILANG